MYVELTPSEANICLVYVSILYLGNKTDSEISEVMLKVPCTDLLQLLRSV